MNPDGVIFEGPLFGRRWRELRGFPSGIRRWPAAPPLAAPRFGRKHYLL